MLLGDWAVEQIVLSLAVDALEFEVVHYVEDNPIPEDEEALVNEPTVRLVFVSRLRHIGKVDNQFEVLLRRTWRTVLTALEVPRRKAIEQQILFL